MHKGKGKGGWFYSLHSLTCSADSTSYPLVIGPITHSLSEFLPSLIHLCVSPCCSRQLVIVIPAPYSMDKVPARPSTHFTAGWTGALVMVALLNSTNAQTVQFDGHSTKYYIHTT